MPEESNGEKKGLLRLLTSADLVPDLALKRAEEDRFRHSALAHRVAELVRSVEPRTNIALYGAWGSGKSTLAGFIEEALGGSEVAFVYYDAWKFGGKALRRNFITNAASRLKLPREQREYKKYYRGLYQSHREAEFHPTSVWKALLALAGIFAGLVILFLVLVCVALAIASTFNDSNFRDQIESHLPDYLGPSGGLAFLIALITAATGAGKIDLDQSAPSDEEEFSQRFRDLIEDARERSTSGGDGRAPIERVVFFIDELDRCDEQDVVQTLVAVRTFLGEDRCVFVVAADRDVLETALQREVEQATPTDVVDPYYTTAGAFLDKIFGHQIEIPPIRGRRLTRFARDLVRDKAGVWQEIVDAAGQGGLDSVIYVLIPAHVRSPRRVKVLLNRFATNARVAQGRGIGWPDRAQEIAKLTALQSEFPTLARDLILEPRLPTLLLDPDQEGLSQRASDLVNRHRVDKDAPPDAEDPDRFLDGEEQDAEGGEDRRKAQRQRHQQMIQRYRAQLHRYLERAARVRNPQRDLLYLEAAGAAVDLEDPELGELIEEQAPEAPEEVIDEVRRRAPNEQVASVRLLADMVQDMIADEQMNVMTAMMTLTSGSETLSDRAALEVANSLRLFSLDKPLDPEHLVGALVVALRVPDEELVRLVSDRPELWDDTDRLRSVALLVPDLPNNLKETLATHLAGAFASDPWVLIDPVRQLDEPYALELMRAPALRDEVERYLADSAADTERRTAVATDLLEAALATKPTLATRTEQLGEAIELLLGTGGESAYQALRDKREAILATRSVPGSANEFIFRVWSIAPEADWDIWPAAVVQTDKPGSREVEAASHLLPRLFAVWPELVEDQRGSFPDVIRSVVSRCSPTPEGELHPVVGTLETLLEPPVDWATDHDMREHREHLHEGARALRALGPTTWQRVEGLLANDIVAGLEYAEVHRNEVPTGSISEAVRGFETMGDPLGLGAMSHLIGHLPEFDASAEPDDASAEVSARASLTSAAKRKESKTPAEFGVAANKVRAVARTNGKYRDEAIANWLALDPTAKQVAPVAESLLPELAPEIEGALARWSSARTRPQRTSLVKNLVRSEKDATQWLRILAQEPLDEAGLVKLLRERVVDGDSVPTRALAAREARIVGLKTRAAGQSLSGAVGQLLKKTGRARGDIDVAAILIAAVPSEQVKEDAWARSLEKRCKERNHHLSKEAVQALQAAGVPLPKKGIGVKLWKKIFG